MTWNCRNSITNFFHCSTRAQTSVVSHVLKHPRPVCLPWPVLTDPEAGESWLCSDCQVEVLDRADLLAVWLSVVKRLADHAELNLGSGEARWWSELLLSTALRSVGEDDKECQLHWIHERTKAIEFNPSETKIYQLTYPAYTVLSLARAGSLMLTVAPGKSRLSTRSKNMSYSSLKLHSRSDYTSPVKNLDAIRDLPRIDKDNDQREMTEGSEKVASA